MTIYKIRGRDTDVSRHDCGRRECFSLGFDRGAYNPGRGYTGGGGTGQARCLTRDVHGCPTNSVCLKCNTASPLHVTEIRGACQQRGCDGLRVDKHGRPAPKESKGFKPLVFSIQRRFVLMFRRGDKVYEFRTRRPKVGDGELVLIYETAPKVGDFHPTSQMIVASATVGRIIDGSPDHVWEVAGKLGGIQKWEFDRYFSKMVDGERVSRDRAVAIELKPTWLSSPRPLWPSMSPPQSWSRWKGPWPQPSWGIAA